ncbi:MAG: HD domain-containing protein [Planctomycetota bacterium]|nr:MAG: HD domain-containing protein [Planctomycetota bacterium]
MEDLRNLDSAQLEERLLKAAGPVGYPSLPEVLAFAKDRHSGQNRKDGQDYICHPLRVALILAEGAELKDANLLSAAVLHDVVEDTETEIGEIEEQFGHQTATLVQALTLPPKREGESSHQQSMAHFKALAWAPRDAQILRSADRLDNLQNMGPGFTAERIQEYAAETRDGLLELTLACNTFLYHALKDAIEASLALEK